LWRVLKPGGVLVISETPNNYYPKEGHTTGLWLNHWLPSTWAHRRACKRGRFAGHRGDWITSGWRGLGYYELRRGVPGSLPVDTGDHTSTAPLTLSPGSPRLADRSVSDLDAEEGLETPTSSTGQPLHLLAKGKALSG
jgi:hypothetical protein